MFLKVRNRFTYVNACNTIYILHFTFYILHFTFNNLLYISVCKLQETWKLVWRDKCKNDVFWTVYHCVPSKLLNFLIIYPLTHSSNEQGFQFKQTNLSSLRSGYIDSFVIYTVQVKNLDGFSRRKKLISPLPLITQRFIRSLKSTKYTVS